MSETVGFIGLGIMGHGMARNLLQADFDLCVWNRTASRMDELVTAGASAAGSPAEIASRCDIFIDHSIIYCLALASRCDYFCLSEPS